MIMDREKQRRTPVSVYQAFLSRTFKFTMFCLIPSFHINKWPTVTTIT